MGQIVTKDTTIFVDTRGKRWMLRDDGRLVRAPKALDVMFAVLNQEPQRLRPAGEPASRDDTDE